MHWKRGLAAGLVAFILVGGSALPHSWAQVPRVIRYQGTLTDSAGTPLDGTYSLTFRFYPAATGGTKTWEEVQTGVAVTNGSFGVLLGSVTPLNLLFNADCWLAVLINNGAELTPRHRIASVPNAYLADRAEKLEKSETIHPGNLLKNGSVESWSNGSAAAPDGWTLTNAVAARETTAAHLGQAAIKLTVSAGSGICRQALPATTLAHFRGMPMTLCAQVKTSTANKVRLTLNDGTGTTTSPNHSGSGAWELLTVSRTISPTATIVEAQIVVDATASATADCVMLNGGSMPFSFNPNPIDSFLVPQVATNSGAVSTTSASYVPLTGMSIANVTVDGTQSVLLTFSGNANYSNPPGEMAFHFRRSGAQISDDSNQAIAPGGGYTARTHSMQTIDRKPAAGTYTYEVYWAVSGSGGNGDARRTQMTAMICPDA